MAASSRCRARPKRSRSASRSSSSCWRSPRRAWASSRSCSGWPSARADGRELMSRRFTLPKLVVATHNRGKAGEIRGMLGRFGVEILSAADLGLPSPPETGTTFEDNATIKALAATRASGLAVLADDSGLSVHALDGQPGLYTADWEGPTRDAMVGTRTASAAHASRRALRALLSMRFLPTARSHDAVGGLHPLAVLQIEVPVLRLQQPRARRRRAGALAQGAADGTRVRRARSSQP